MNIIFNDSPLTYENPPTIQRLLIELNQLKPGIALAVNQQIIPREQWDKYTLQDGDSLLLFQAIAGG